MDRRDFLKRIPLLPGLVVGWAAEEPPVDCVTIRADDVVVPPVTVYFEGQDVSRVCMAMHAAREPGRPTTGWVETFTQWPPIMDLTGKPLTQTLHGTVWWEPAGV